MTETPPILDFRVFAYMYTCVFCSALLTLFFFFFFFWKIFLAF